MTWNLELELYLYGIHHKTDEVAATLSYHDAAGASASCLLSSTLERHLEGLPIIRTRPNPILPRRKHTLRIQRILNFLIELRISIIIEAISPSNLIHQRQMRPILSPTQSSSIINKHRDHLVRTPPRIRISTIKDNADDMVHLTHTDHESTDEVEAKFFATAARELILCYCVVAADFGDWAEEEMCAVGEPVDPFEFGDAGDALKRVMSCL